MTTATKPERRARHNGTNALTYARRFTVDEFYRIGETDIFSPEDRLELLDGVIMPMAPIGPRHARSVTAGHNWFGPRLPPEADIRSQNPVRLAIDSELIPDIAIVVRRADGYGERHPLPEDVFLLIEVSDTTFRYDSDLKVPRYARAGIRELWIADLEHGVLLVYRSPRRGRYVEQIRFERGDTITPLAFPELIMPVEVILV